MSHINIIFFLLFQIAVQHVPGVVKQLCLKGVAFLPAQVEDLQERLQQPKGTLLQLIKQHIFEQAAEQVQVGL